MILKKEDPPTPSGIIVAAMRSSLVMALGVLSRISVVAGDGGDSTLDIAIHKHALELTQKIERKKLITYA